MPVELKGYVYILYWMFINSIYMRIPLPVAPAIAVLYISVVIPTHLCPTRLDTRICYYLVTYRTHLLLLALPVQWVYHLAQLDDTLSGPLRDLGICRKVRNSRFESNYYALIFFVRLADSWEGEINPISIMQYLISGLDTSVNIMALTKSLSIEGKENLKYVWSAAHIFALPALKCELFT